MREYNVHEALAILKKYYITDSQQMVTRWIRQGRIQGVRSDYRKEGYLISEESLFDFIEEERPGLSSVYEIYDEFIKNLQVEKNRKLDIELDIEEIHLKLRNLEEQLLEVQQEKQIVEMNLIEQLEEKRELEEENELLTELYELIQADNEQLKKQLKQLNTSTLPTKQNKDSHNTKSKYNVSYSEFERTSTDLLDELNVDLKDLSNQEQLKKVYNELFEKNGELRSELLDSGNIICPYTKKSLKQVKRIINNALRHHFSSVMREDQAIESMIQVSE
ncbi:hypothetical protein F9802_15180 [Bacillus aerolatus]|uniref:Uncharacterized protein n=1 Tax=Bacillus aerolatus TaxID=2653354 RepID=A0A6I1FM57_9BACI|nr:hypothetical protein [Bacillus aerolatus]KAB7704906.1 hypothetical protein F9802_15180 [Bacillus aerolatus]